MPATTRSQTTLEEQGVSSSKCPQAKSAGTKRKASDAKATPAKKQKKRSSEPAKPQSKEEKESNDDTKDEPTAILINRAPVLELWASAVTQFLYPSLPWTTCLSVGGAISTMTALSKGRSIGTMNKPDPGEQQEKREKRRDEQAELDEVQVMSFHLKLKEGSAMVGDKPKKGNEGTLSKKYGADAYVEVKKTFEESLAGWKGKENELNDRAFSMYEDFRPNVATGQKGWGRKAQLNLQTITSAVG